MFWDKIAVIYEPMETIYNGKANESAGNYVASQIHPEDSVLECACGTGIFSRKVAARCRKLTATDFSPKMLKKAAKKCKRYGNITFENGNILNLKYADNSFDKALAANVIHLLDDPDQALSELKRVVKPGGQLILPVYLNENSKSASCAASLANKVGANFKRQFTTESYKQFYRDRGFDLVDFYVAEGRMSCGIAVLSVKKRAS